MERYMIWRTTLLATLALTAVAFGQVPVPPISGGPVISGTLHYDLRFSQIMNLGAATDNNLGQTSSVSGDAGYNSTSEHYPFGLLYSGGGLWTTQAGSENTSFQNLQVTQGFVSRKWVINISDNVSYLPQAPTTGASGIPGVGDLTGSLGFGILPPGDIPNQSILTNYAPRVSNAASGGLEYRLDGSTSLTGSGSFGLLKFPDGGGLDGTQENASFGVKRRLDARNTIGVNYVYSRFEYDVSGFAIASQGGEVTFTRQWSRKLKSDIGLGPQWMHSSDTTLLQDSTSVAGSAGLEYTLDSATSTNLRYIRGLNGGSGVVEGGMTDSVQLGISRMLSRDWTLALMGSFARTDAPQIAGLQTACVYTTKYGGTQVSRRLGRHASAYLSYTAMALSAPETLFGNALNGLTHVFGIGFEFSPRETRLKGR
jgi:hypothetical protein